MLSSLQKSQLVSSQNLVFSVYIWVERLFYLLITVLLWCLRFMLFVGQNRTTMPIDREITRPMLGTDQEPTAITWKSTLRSPVSSPRGPTQTRQSRSRTQSSNALQSSLRSRTPSPLNQSLNNSSSNIRKSHSGWVLWQTALQLLPSLTQVLWSQTPCMLWLNIRKMIKLFLSIYCCYCFPEFSLVQ